MLTVGCCLSRTSFVNYEYDTSLLHRSRFVKISAWKARVCVCGCQAPAFRLSLIRNACSPTIDFSRRVFPDVAKCMGLIPAADGTMRDAKREENRISPRGRNICNSVSKNGCDVSGGDTQKEIENDDQDRLKLIWYEWWFLICYSFLV